MIMQEQILNVFENKLVDALREADDATLTEGRAIWENISPAPSCPFVGDVMRNIQHVLARGHVAREHVLMKLVSETIASYEKLLSPKFNESLMDVIRRAFPKDHYLQFAKNTQGVYKRRALGQNKKFNERDFEREFSLISVSASSMSNQAISRACTLIEEASIKKAINTQSIEARALRLEPKPPEIIPKIIWIWRYGHKYWKVLLIALIVTFFIGGFKYYPTITGIFTKIFKSNPVSDEQKIQKELPAPLIHFSDGSTGLVEISNQVQLDPNLVEESYLTYGSAEAALSSLQTSIQGAAISVLETKTKDYVRTHREEVSAEIIKRTEDAQKRTAYIIVELSIGEIN
jgi:hypothetical protein